MMRCGGVWWAGNNRENRQELPGISRFLRKYCFMGGLGVIAEGPSGILRGSWREKLGIRWLRNTRRRVTFCCLIEISVET